jgi:hypothetical protein
MDELMTRYMYMHTPFTTPEDATARHRRYFGQFVTDETIAQVVRHIGADRLLSSENRDGAFNDIPLREWDYFSGWNGGLGSSGTYGPAPLICDRVKLREANPDIKGFFGSDFLCIAKEAARIYVDRAKAN